MVKCGVQWFNTVWFGLHWYDMVWFGMIWCGVVFYFIKIYRTAWRSAARLLRHLKTVAPHVKFKNGKVQCGYFFARLPFHSMVRYISLRFASRYFRRVPFLVMCHRWSFFFPEGFPSEAIVGAGATFNTTLH